MINDVEEIQKLMEKKARTIVKILIRRREQFIKAFIAKYKCEPDEVIINEQPSFFDKETHSMISRWWLTRKEDFEQHCKSCNCKRKIDEVLSEEK